MGELIQIDGCEHHWFEDRGPMCTALVFVDDATSRLMAVRFTGTEFQTALLETAFHHAHFMGNTNEPWGWTSQFREIHLDIHAGLHDLRNGDSAYSAALDPDSYQQAQGLGERLHSDGAEGLVFPSVRNPTGQCAGLFYPDLASHVIQGRHLDYHWNGTRVDLFREPAKQKVYRIL